MSRPCVITSLFCASLCSCGSDSNPRRDAGSVALEAALVIHTLNATVLPSEAITADASGSRGEGELNYAFDWGDRSDTGPQSSATANHTYTRAGTYEITVTVSVHSSVMTSTATAAVSVVASQPPRVSINQPSMTLPGHSFTVDASASIAPNGHVVTYQFNLLGAAGAITQSDPVASFEIDYPCSCGVQVIATDDHGYSGQAAQGIQVGLQFPSKTRIPSEATNLTRFEPSLARDTAGALDVTWYDNGSFAFSQSTNAGTSFRPQTMIATQTSQWSVEVGFGSNVAVTPSGTILGAFTWVDTQGDSAIELVRSADAGASFAPVSMTDTTVPLPFFDDEGASNGAPSFAIVGTSIVMSWLQDVSPAVPSTATRFAVSKDDGKTWQLVSQLPNENPEPTGMPMAVEGSSIFISRVVAGALGVSRSDDLGLSFTDPVVIDSESKIRGELNYAGGGRLAVAWTVGDSSPILKLSVSDDLGATWSQPHEASLSGDIVQCATASVDGEKNIYIAYSSGPANGIGDYAHVLVATRDGSSFGPRFSVPMVVSPADCVHVMATAPGDVDLYWSEINRGTGLFDVFFSSGQIVLP